MSWKLLKHPTIDKLLVYLAILFFVCFSFGQLQRGQIIPGVAIYAHDVVIGVWLSLWFWFKRQEFAKPLLFLAKSKMVWWIIGWAGLGLVASFTNSRDLIISLLYLGRLLFYAFFTYLIMIKLDWNKLTVLKDHVPQPATKMLIFAGLVILYFGLVQFAFLPDTRFLTVLGWDDHYWRLISTLLDPAFTGMILVLTLLSWLTQRITDVKFMKYSVVIALLIGITLTFSRSTYAALAVGLLSLTGLTWLRQKKLYLYPVGLLILFTIFMLAIPKPAGEGGNLLRSSTVIARASNTEATLQSLQPYQWLIGKGLFKPFTDPARADGLTDIPDHSQVPDNLIIMLISGVGLGGVALLIFLAVYYKKNVWSLPSWTIASLLAVLSHSLFNNTLFQPFVWLWITAIIWLGLSKSEIDG